MSAPPFLDSNIVVYAFDQTAPEKQMVAQRLLAQGGTISVQTLNECANVLRRKQRRGWADIRAVVALVRTCCAEPAPLTVREHEQALELAAAHGVGLYDALILASALSAGCDTLLSEDLQDGRTFDGRLTVRNPFAAL